MSIEESYLRSTRSSHLEWKPTVGDVDRLTAAGLVRETVATRLIRLRADFDAVSAISPTGLIIMRLLRGYPDTHAFLLVFARKEAATRKGAPGEDEIEEIVTKVLSLFLDPNCKPCDGRGFTGGNGAPTVRCSACRESGRRAPYFKTDQQDQFARWLQSAIDSKLTLALDHMKRMLRA